MADQQFCLRWNNHQSTLISVFDTLLENGTLVDCTLAAEGQYLKAHKVVLSACSPYLETLLSQHYEKHPIVILKDVKFTELKSMMDYMYRGEVNISQDQLGTFLKAAESLQIKGLSDNAEGDARDVGSTPKGAPPPKRTAQPAPPVQPQRPESPAHRDGSISPSSRKRRRIRRGSQGEDSNMGDSHLDANSCDLPSQAQSTPIVPNIPSSISTTIKTPIVKPEQTELVNRIDTSNLNSLPPESGLLKEKIEPISEPLLEPKTEYLDDSINDDNVEDLTLDDDDDMDMSNMSSVSNMSRPGPSHGNDVSQGFAPWQLGGNQSGTDEVFMAAQEAVNAHRDSQDLGSFHFASCGVLDDTLPTISLLDSDSDAGSVVISLSDNECQDNHSSIFSRSTLTRNGGVDHNNGDVPKGTKPKPKKHNTSETKLKSKTRHQMLTKKGTMVQGMPKVAFRRPKGLRKLGGLKSNHCHPKGSGTAIRSSGKENVTYNVRTHDMKKKLGRPKGSGAGNNSGKDNISSNDRTCEITKRRGRPMGSKNKPKVVIRKVRQDSDNNEPSKKKITLLGSLKSKMKAVKRPFGRSKSLDNGDTKNYNSSQSVCSIKNLRIVLEKIPISSSQKLCLSEDKRKRGRPKGSLNKKRLSFSDGSGVTKNTPDIELIVCKEEKE